MTAGGGGALLPPRERSWRRLALSTAMLRSSDATRWLAARRALRVACRVALSVLLASCAVRPSEFLLRLLRPLPLPPDDEGSRREPAPTNTTTQVRVARDKSSTPYTLCITIECNRCLALRFALQATVGHLQLLPIEQRLLSHLCQLVPQCGKVIYQRTFTRGASIEFTLHGGHGGHSSVVGLPGSLQLGCEACNVTVSFSDVSPQGGGCVGSSLPQHPRFASQLGRL